MPLHPAVKQYLESIPACTPGFIPTPEEQRRAFDSFAVPLDKRTAIHSIEERTIPGSDFDIPIRIYTPKEDGLFPLLVFFHGGGFYMGSIESHDEIIRRMAVESGYKIIAVEYRLAPEYPFPIPLNDCYAATKWMVEHAKELNGDPTRIAVGGDSAGGNLAAAVTLMARDKKEFEISKQILIYPATDLDSKAMCYPSRIENGEGFGSGSKMMSYTYNLYLTEQGDVNHPYASPIKAKNFSDLPSALVITAEYDSLRDEGEYYVSKLLEAGIHVENKRYEGVIHGFLLRFPDLEEYTEVYSLIALFLNK